MGWRLITPALGVELIAPEGRRHVAPGANPGCVPIGPDQRPGGARACSPGCQPGGRVPIGPDQRAPEGRRGRGRVNHIDELSTHPAVIIGVQARHRRKFARAPGGARMTDRAFFPGFHPGLHATAPPGRTSPRREPPNLSPEHNPGLIFIVGWRAARLMTHCFENVLGEGLAEPRRWRGAYRPGGARACSPGCQPGGRVPIGPDQRAPEGRRGRGRVNHIDELSTHPAVIIGVQARHRRKFARAPGGAHMTDRAFFPGFHPGLHATAPPGRTSPRREPPNLLPEQNTGLIFIVGWRAARLMTHCFENVLGEGLAEPRRWRGAYRPGGARACSPGCQPGGRVPIGPDQRAPEGRRGRGRVNHIDELPTHPAVVIGVQARHRRKFARAPGGARMTDRAFFPGFHPGLHATAPPGRTSPRREPPNLLPEQNTDLIFIVYW